MEPAPKRRTLLEFGGTATHLDKTIHEVSLPSVPTNSADQPTAKRQRSEAQSPGPSSLQQSSAIPSPPKFRSPISQPQTVPKGLALLPKHQDPWRKYYPRLNVRQGAAAILAKRIPSDGELYAITESRGGNKQTYLQVLRELQQYGPSLVVEVIETFDWNDSLFVISEYVDVSLAQIIASIRGGFFILPESEVAFIVNEVKLLTLA
jgi:hypothetical protein